jgi:hypothetical protein
LIVNLDSKALLTLKRLATAWPILALPAIPMIGKAIAAGVLWMALAHTALQ